jgi:DNA invertase Pin-like site-specific DNA recombinase
MAEENPIPTGYDKAMVRRARQLRAEAMSVAEIARATGYSLGWVKKAVRGEPIPEALRRRYAKDAERERALAMRAAGVPPRTIAAELGVNVSTVYQWIAPGASRSKPGRRAGAVPRDPAADDRLVPAVIELRRAGLSVERTAAHLHVGADRVRRILSREDVPRELMGRRPKSAEREAACAMRLEGASIPAIARALDVARSTAWVWTKDLPVPEEFCVKGSSPGQRAAHQAWAADLRARRELQRATDHESAYSEVGSLSSREVLLLGGALYWAEGAKSKPWERRENVVFCNSDPSVIRFFLRFCREIGVDRAQLRARLQIHVTADVAAAEAYWRDVTGLPSEQFHRTTLKQHNPKTNRKNRNNEHYHGCLTIRVTGGAAVYRRIEGLWAGIAGSHAQ